jgi:hypothetical protein
LMVSKSHGGGNTSAIRGSTVSRRVSNKES